MIVTPIASTTFTPDLPDSVTNTNFEKRLHDGDSSAEIDLLHEFAGRACYQAWNLPNPGTHENEDYLANILRQGHFSVLEHGSVTFYVEGVSRSLTHELIRHRHLSYSELSQRYVDVSKARVIAPPACTAISGIEDYEMPEESVEAYEIILEGLMEAGISGKKAREAARSVLPGGTETRIVVTGNLRAWRDMLHKRWHVAADAEIREFAGEILKHLRTIAPHSVQDIPEAPFQ